MANIVSTQNPDKYNLATGFNIFTIRNTDTDKYPFSLRLKEDDVIVSSLKQLGNTFNYSHFDVGKILSYKVGYTDNLESITQCSTATKECIKYEALMAHYENNIITNESQIGTNYYVLNGRKSYEQLYWDYEQYMPVYTGTLFGPGGTILLNRIKNYEPLTDKDVSKTIDISINDKYTLTFMNDYIYDDINGVGDIQYAGIYSFSFRFYNSNNSVINEHTFEVLNNQNTGGGPSLTNSTIASNYDTTDSEGKYKFISVQIMNSNTLSVLQSDSDVAYFRVTPKLIYPSTTANYNLPAATGVKFQLKDYSCTPFDEVQFSWINSLGFRDYYTFNQKHETRFVKKSKTYERTSEAWASPAFTIDNKRFDVEYDAMYHNEYSTTSDWLNDEEMEYLNNLLISPNVNVKLPNSNEFTPITILDKNWVSRKYKNDRLYQLTLNYKLAYKQKIQNG